MTEQMNLETAVMENARRFHENYLLKCQEKDLQDAIDNYVEALSINPQNAKCYYRLASLMYESGQITLESTIEQCQKAIALNPKNINAYIYAGYYLEQAQDFSSAESSFKHAIKLSEFKSARARLILASTIKRRLQTQGFRLSGALQYLYYMATGGITFLADFSAVKMLYKSVADVAVVKTFDMVGNVLEKFSPDSAIGFYKRVMNRTQRFEYFYEKIADLYIVKENSAEAIDCCKKSLSLNPNNKSALAKLATLTQAYYPEKVDLIIDYYNMLLDMEEEDLAPIYYELGHLYLQKGDKIHSVGAFKLALEGNEDNPYYNDALAYAYVQAELYDDAIEYYQKAIKLNPSRLWTVNLCHSLGLIYQKCKENYEAAIASFQAGSVLDPENEDIMIALGDVYSILKDYDSAVRTYEDVLLMNPNNCDANSKLGIAYYGKRQIPQAIEAYRRALELNPEHDVTYNNLGIIYLEELKDYDAALEAFGKALEINPNYTLAYFNKGRASQKRGDCRTAASCYQMAIDLNRVMNVLDEEEIKTRLEELFDV